MFKWQLVIIVVWLNLGLVPHSHGIVCNHGDGVYTSGESLACALQVGGRQRFYTMSGQREGHGEAHNNMSPYIVCNMWERTK